MLYVQEVDVQEVDKKIGCFVQFLNKVIQVDQLWKWTTGEYSISEYVNFDI